METFSLFISLFALLFSWFSLYENRKSNRIVQKPFLIGHEIINLNSYIYVISNEGSGTAYFKEVVYFYKKKPVKYEEFRKHISEVLSFFKINAVTITNRIGNNIALRSGGTLRLGQLIFNQFDFENIQKIEDSELGIRIKYSSAYGEIESWATNDELKKISVPESLQN